MLPNFVAHKGLRDGIQYLHTVNENMLDITAFLYELRTEIRRVSSVPTCSVKYFPPPAVILVVAGVALLVTVFTLSYFLILLRIRSHFRQQTLCHFRRHLYEENNIVN